MNILIIGYGVVGKNMHKIFPDADIADPFTHTASALSAESYDVAFVCVPTPMDDDGSCDASIVEEAINEHKDHVRVFCIRSTVPPGTTAQINNSDDDISAVFSPEYYGETIHANGADYDFIILGGERWCASVVAEAYKARKHSRLRFYFTDSKTAELCKYMENCWLATKVTFCNEFYRIAKNSGIDYNELRELWLADPRINRSHTWVFENQPYYDSKCLNKDIPALMCYSNDAGHVPDLINAVYATNEEHKKNA